MGFATALTAAGIGIQAGSQYQAGQIASAEAKAAAVGEERNAQVAEQNALAAKYQSRWEQIKLAKRGRQMRGSMRAGQGARGVEQDLELQEELMSEIQLDQALAGYRGLVRAGQFESEAAMRRYQGGIYGMRGKYARKVGLVGGVTSFLTGLGGMYENAMIGKVKKPDLSGVHVNTNWGQL